MRTLIYEDPVSSSIEWIWSRDPALDWKDRSDFPDGKIGDEAFSRYMEEEVLPIWRRYTKDHDASILPIKEGWAPVTWVIGCLTTEQAQVVSMMTGYGAHRARVTFGLRDVRGLHDSKGNPVLVKLVSGPHGPEAPQSIIDWIAPDEYLLTELSTHVLEGGLLTQRQRKSDQL